MVVPEHPQPFEYRRAGIQRRVMPDRDLQAFIIFLAGLPSQLRFGVLVGFAVILVFLPQHAAVLIDESRALIEQFLGGRNVARPRHVRHSFDLFLGPGDRIGRNFIIGAKPETHLSEKRVFHRSTVIYFYSRHQPENYETRD